MDKFQKICLFVYLSSIWYVCLSVYLSIYLSVWLSICLPNHLDQKWWICAHYSHRWIKISINLSVCPSNYLSINISLCLSVSACHKVCKSIYSPVSKVINLRALFSSMDNNFSVKAPKTVSALLAAFFIYFNLWS